MTPACSNRALRLTPAQFHACWNSLGLGETPPLLHVRPPGYTMAEHRRLIVEATRELRQRELYTTDQPAPELTRMLWVLARPDYMLDLRYVADTQNQVLGLGAIAGERGTIVVSDGTGSGPLALLSLPSHHVANRLLTLTGPITPGHSSTVNIAVETLEEARAAAPAGDIWQVAENLQTRGVPRTDTRRLGCACAATFKPVDSSAPPATLTARSGADRG